MGDHKQRNSEVEENMTETVNNENTKRKPYSKPEVIHELELETRAGSPTGVDPIDILPKQ